MKAAASSVVADSSARPAATTTATGSAVSGKSSYSFVKYHGLGNDYFVLDPNQTGGSNIPPSQEVQRQICHRQYGLGSDGILFGPAPNHVLPDDTPAWRALASAIAADTKSADSKQSSQAVQAVQAVQPPPFVLRIYNSDGSEAKKSGNGLRIFSRYLYDTGRVQLDVAFRVQTLGGCVTSTIRRVTAPNTKPTSAAAATAAATAAPAPAPSAVMNPATELEISIDMGVVSFWSADIPMSGEPRSSLKHTFTLDGKEYQFSAASIGMCMCCCGGGGCDLL